MPACQQGDHQGLIVSFANDGIAEIPGALRVYVASIDGKVRSAAAWILAIRCREKISQAQFVLPSGIDLKGMKLIAEVEVKGVRYPVQWGCLQ